MPSPKVSERKVSVSFTNWILGGSLVSLNSYEGDTRRRRSSGRRVFINEYDSNGNEIIVKEIGRPKTLEKKEGEVDVKQDDKKDGDAKKKDGDEKKSGDDGKEKKKDKDKDENEKGKEKKKCCETCGKEAPEVVEKTTEGGDAAKKNDMERKSDEKNADDSKKHDHGEATPSWTDAQTFKLKEMKEANKSWKEIAAEVDHNQGACKHRYKDLQKTPEEKSSDSTKNDASSNTPGGWESGWDNPGNDAGNLSFGDLFMDAPAGTSEKPNHDSSWNNQSQDNNGGMNRDGRNGNDAQGGDRDHSVGGKQHQAGEPGWSYHSNRPSSPRHQPQGRLRSNDVWSKDYCEVLEILEAQYREHKWLQIQAGFYNWTGRMISADLIESKFREDGAA